MDTEWVQDIQVFFKAICEVAIRCRTEEVKETAVTCIEKPSFSRKTLSKRGRSTETSCQRGRSRSARESPSKSPVKPIVQWSLNLEYLKAIASTHFDPGNPYLNPAPVSSALLRDIYRLLVYEEAVFEKHQSELLRCWNVLAQSRNNDIDWEAALLATVIHCFACALRELHDTTDENLPELLLKKRPFWRALSGAKLQKLLQIYREKHPTIRNLILDIIIVVGQASAEPCAFYQRRTKYLFAVAKRNYLYKLDISGVSELERILEMDEIKAIYLKICRNDAHPISDEEYAEALRHFCSNMFLTELKNSLLIYGVTLTGRQVIIDSAKPDPGRDDTVLLKAYRLLNLMHEYAHFLLQASTRNFQEFIRCSTPSKSGHPPLPQTMTKVRQIIQDNFPLNYHGEAGTMLEEELFGAKLLNVNIHAAKVLIDLSVHPKSVTEFAVEFDTANKVAVSPSQKMGLERGDLENERDMMVRGSCGMIQPPLHTNSQ